MKSTLRNMMLSLGAIASVAGLILGLMNDATADARALARTAARSEAIARVLPPFDNNPLGTADTAAGCTVYRATRNGSDAGYAVTATSPDGFGGPLTVMAGFDTAGTLTGYEILESTETPGLGSKAGEWFRNPSGHRSVLGSRGILAVTKDGGDIDAISGATITSRAFTDALNTARRAFETYRKRQ